MKTFDELIKMSDEEITAYRKGEVQWFIDSCPTLDRANSLLAFQATIEEAIEDADSPLDFCGTYLFKAKANIKMALGSAQSLLTTIKTNQGDKR